MFEIRKLATAIMEQYIAGTYIAMDIAIFVHDFEGLRTVVALAEGRM
jgi:hypothetical protein